MKRLLAGPGLAVLLALTSPAAASADTATFVAEDAEQTFSVPTGVSSIHVVAIGGHGGGTATAFGALVSGDLAVSPGQVLFVEVAGNGTSGAPSTGGFNGGGGGGRSASGGGGASDLRMVSASVTGSLSSRLIVAAGGGGGYSSDTTVNFYGGQGGAAGADGTDGAGFPSHGDGGDAGTASSGGAGGPPLGMAGDLGVGGAGGTDSTHFGGGGGGGGYYGGGGGGVGASETPVGGGGGGGSSFTGAAINSFVGADTSGTPSIAITYTPPPAGGAGGGGSSTPALATASGLAFSNQTFAAESSGPPATTAKRKKAPRGTEVSFNLNAAARIRFTVTRRLKGRKFKRGKKTVCAKPTKKNRKRKRCTRVVTLKGSFSRDGVAGENSFHFTGRLRGRKLKPGKYRLVATPTAAGAKGKATSTGFRIVR